MPLFINPGVHPKSQWAFITRRMALQPPMGIGFLAGYLRAKRGAGISILDEALAPLTKDMLKQAIFRMDSPRMICISSMTIQIGRALQLAAMAKAIDPGATVILGGIHPTVLPHESLRGNVDVVVRYEGEDTLLALYDCIREGKDYRHLDGISLREDSGGFKDNPPPPPMRLDSDFPLFPYDLFDSHLDRYNCFGSLSSSRGCPHNCIFCSNRTITGNLFRHFPLEWIEETLDILINKYKQTYIMFLDDVIFVNKKHFFDIVDMIDRRGFNKKAAFHGGARADTVTEEIIRQSKRANFAFFGVGVETGSDSLLKTLNKKESAAQIKHAIDLITSQGIMTSGAFIYGIPGESPADRKHSLRYALSLPIDNARFNNIVPYPGTRLFDIAKEQGRLWIEDDYYNFNVQYYLFGDSLPYVPPGVNRHELIFDLIWANMRFYLRLRTFQRFKKSPTTGGGTIHVPKKTDFSLYWDIFRFALFVALRLARVTPPALAAKLGRFLNRFKRDS